MVLHDVFSEIHEFDENNRDLTFEYGIKGVDSVLGSEGTIKTLEGIELTECNEMVDSDNRGILINLNLEIHFDE